MFSNRIKSLEIISVFHKFHRKYILVSHDDINLESLRFIYLSKNEMRSEYVLFIWQRIQLAYR